VSARASADLRERLANAEAVLSRSDLAALGYGRRAVDAIFRHCPVEFHEGYSRGLIRVGDFLAYRQARTFRGDRVRPSHRQFSVS
jgi:hypothetical protein